MVDRVIILFLIREPTLRNCALSSGEVLQQSPIQYTLSEEGRMLTHWD